MGSKLTEFLNFKMIESSEIPNFLKSNVHYETMMGSHAYGCEREDSDIDVYGFCVPPKNVIFPHLDGEIIGFGRQKQNVLSSGHLKN